MIMTPRIFFIGNTESGKGIPTINDASYAHLNIVSKESIQQDPDALMERIKTTDFDVLAAMGGDGTISAAFTMAAALNLKQPILMLPSGTTNDIAKNYYETVNIEEILTTTDFTKTITTDLGIVNDKVFSYALTFGYLSNVPYTTDQKLKNKFGYFAYMLRGFWEIWKLKKYRLDVTVDDEIVKGKFSFVSITNTKKMANFVRFPDSTDLADGLFEVMLVRTPKTPVQLVKALHQINTQSFEDDSIIFRRAKKVTINSESTVEYGLDGEFGGKTKQIQFNVEPEPIMLVGPLK